MQTVSAGTDSRCHEPPVETDPDGAAPVSHVLSRGGRRRVAAPVPSLTVMTVWRILSPKPAVSQLTTSFAMATPSIDCRRS